jgi:hypothetical protein
LASEFIPSELIPIIWFCCISVTAYVFFRVFSSTLKEKFRLTNLSRKKAEAPGNTDNQVDSLIDNAPRMLNEVNKIINEQTEAGVPPDQMKGLLQKKQLLELVSNNAEVINIIGKPVLKKILGFVRHI